MPEFNIRDINELPPELQSQVTSMSEGDSFTATFDATITSMSPETGEIITDVTSVSDITPLGGPALEEGAPVEEGVEELAGESAGLEDEVPPSLVVIAGQDDAEEEES